MVFGARSAWRLFGGCLGGHDAILLLTLIMHSACPFAVMRGELVLSISMGLVVAW